MSDELSWMEQELTALEGAGLLRRRRIVKSLPGGWCEVDGRKLRNLAANDYLCLAHDPRVIGAAGRALQESGAGSGASALVSGRTPWHAALEERIARFEGQEAAILFPTGYAANVGTICALVGEGDTVFCDRLNHASLVDGCRLSGARLRVYRHDELDVLERELSKSNAAGRHLITTDAVFSMDGDLAPLPALCDLAGRFRAMLLVDEAHGTGVFGEKGRGVSELQGVEERVTVRVGTLSKAVGSLGGFVAGSKRQIDWLWNKARPQIYSTALPSAACAAAMAAFDVIDGEPERRKHLQNLSAEFRRQLRDADVVTTSGSAGPIVPVILNDPNRAIAAAEALEKRGYVVAAIRPPTVPEGTSRLRITLNAGLSISELAEFSEAVRDAVWASSKSPGRP